MSPHRAVPQRGSDANPEDAPDRRNFRKNYVAGNAFEFCIAVASVLSAVTFFAWPAALLESSVGQQVPEFAVLWNVLYFCSGVLLLHGLWMPKLREELAGLSLFAGAVLVNAGAIVVIRGPAGLAVAITYLSLACAAGLRGWLIASVIRRGGGG